MTPADRLFASFDRIYILNLPERADRRTEMAGELARIGTGFDDPRIMADIARRLRGEAPFSTLPAAPLPN